MRSSQTNQRLGSRSVRLRQFPRGAPVSNDFNIVEDVLAPPLRGQILVRNLWLSVDPFMRLGIGANVGAAPGLKPGDIMIGGAVGVVEASQADGFRVGDIVFAFRLGWRERYIAGPDAIERVSADVPSLSWHLGALGLPGITAYAGIEHIMKPKPGEIVYVSGASGAVGHLACQLAKRRGAFVIGSAGTDAKAKWLVDALGIDVAFNYRTTGIKAFLTQQGIDGLNAYFDNVGGATLNEALQSLKAHGRIVVCGAISQYNSDHYRRGPDDFFAIVEKGAVITGVQYRHFEPMKGAIVSEMSALLQSGAIKCHETIFDGLDQTPEAFLSLFSSKCAGKVVVKLAAS